MKEAVEMQLSKEAINKLLHFNLSIEEVEKTLTNTIEAVINKYNPLGYYLISKEDIVVAHLSEIKLSVREQNLNKTEHFLDRYEEAVKLLLSKNEKVTGLNIGNACYPKVSPAAISDVLKKHQKKMVSLFQKYPNKWSNLRKHFKPIVNITERFTILNELLKKGA